MGSLAIDFRSSRTTGQKSTCGWGFSEVRIVHAEERSNYFDGLEEGLPPCEPISVDLTVVLVRIRRAIHELHRATFRLGAVGTIVLLLHGALRSEASRVEIP